jgi:hypothetical protein
MVNNRNLYGGTEKMNVNMQIILKENNRILSNFPHDKEQLYFDTNLSMVFDRPVLDVPMFDAWMHKIYGEYEDEQGLSLYELLVKEKGVEFAEYIKGFI